MSRRESASDPGRRRLLGLVAGAAALAAFPAAAGPAADDLRLARRLVGLFAAPESAAQVGRRYLRVAPQEASVPRLLAAIAAGPDVVGDGAGRLDALGPAALRAEFAGRIRADFAAGRLVRLDGWMLSATETRLMGLAALVPGPA